jgi:phosphatidylserine decarboxylase
VYYFFRDPERFPINDENYLLSPADGIISQIIETNGPSEIGLENKKYTRVSIFMNVFNCHVNRIPSSGKITQIFYKSGKFLNASLDKASEDNERNYVKMKNNNGDELIVVQIAGLIARRIVCEVKENDEIKQGNKFGIIRFGSRVDLYFENYKILVRENQKTISGETLIARKIKND